MAISTTSIIIHRGTHQIGGCVTELRAGKNRLFIDIGANLPGNGTELPPIDGLTVGDGANSALLITHYHGDHIGLLDKVLPNVSVNMGKTAKAVYRGYMERVSPDKLPIVERIQTFEAFAPIDFGNFSVLPLLSDHSAFGAFIFVIEADGVRVLHTGDFRLHGIVGKRLLSKWLPRFAQDIDYIICEGTTLSRDGEPLWSEYDLRKKARDLMNDKPYVFALCSSTNIDRIGTFYHANPKGRLFICDEYQKKQLQTVADSLDRRGGFYDLKHVYRYAPNLDNLMEENGFCMLVRRGEQFRRVMEKYKDNCLVIYSMWTGYLDERAKNQDLVDFLAPYRYRVLHTSGHAAPEDIKRLYDTVHPKCGLIPIHTDAPESFGELVDKVIILNDGETLCLQGDLTK